MVSVSHPFNFEDIYMVSVCSVENHAPPVVFRGEPTAGALFLLVVWEIGPRLLP